MSPSLRVKICGITNRDDALVAIDAGADALGFNLYPGSKRHVRIEEITPWLSELPGDALKIAVMVNPPIDEILRVQPLFDAVQLHGQETPALCQQASATGIIWKAFPVTESLAAHGFRPNAILIDSSVSGAFGGTGTLIDLDQAARFVESCKDVPIWLSGGLTPSNVAQAVEKVRPFGVDVASGVEVSGNPRRKDSASIRAFIAAARRASE